MQRVFQFVEQSEKLCCVLGGWKVAKRNAKIDVATGVLLAPGIGTEKVEATNSIPVAKGRNAFFYFLQVHGAKLVGSGVFGNSNLSTLLSKFNHV